MTKTPDLSLVITNWNGLSLLKDCLPSVHTSTKKITFEIILVDNASDDDSIAWCEEHFPHIEIVALEENLGFTGGNNKGLGLCRGEFILLLNNDTIVQEGALDNLIEFMRSRPEVGACGPKLLNADRSLQHSSRSFPSMWTEFCQEFYLSALFPKSYLFSKYYYAFWNHDETIKVDFVTGAALMVRKSVFDEVGYLDAENFLFFYEETDLCMRIKNKGHAIYFVHDSEVIHLGGASYENLNRTFHYHMLNSRYNYHIKHNGYIVKPILWLIHLNSSVIYCIVFGFLRAFNFKKNSTKHLYKRYASTLRYHVRRLLNRN